jgi:hypothetical protein
MGSLVDAACTVEVATARSTADATHSRGLIFRTANSTSSVSPSVDIPVNCRGRYWDVLTVGANAQFAFVLSGDTAPTLVYNQASVMGTGAAAAAPTLVDGLPKSMFCPVNAVRYVFISSAAAGFIEAVVSGELTGK